MAAYRQALLLAVVVAAACLAPLASATQWMVGDDEGWRAQFNLTGWADGKTFRVGDSLMFMYNKDAHTVAQLATKEDFAACNLQANLIGFWDSGNDVITLSKPGKTWFICTKPNHCLTGMKLVIDVVEDGAWTPAPAPAPAPAPIAHGWMVGDSDGWRAKFNETGWANGKTFMVGDSLMFMYDKSLHTVAQVGKDDFAACNLQGNQIGFWDSGNDDIKLNNTGKMWFICTKPNHCLNGMKLVIDVQGGAWAPAPGPTPAAPAPDSSAPVSYALGGAVAAAGAALVAAAALAF
ncbi:hypothetical protein U9M48_011813 [Paspalum notatum var. saurae]|uniref:Phytocyanin domain-containing protein n=1 Tax=Paspalum notatum var. saurae TaxID=547442 RepID=A0AAQ3SWE5_PASNO